MSTVSPAKKRNPGVATTSCRGWFCDAAQATCAECRADTDCAPRTTGHCDGDLIVLDTARCEAGTCTSIPGDRATPCEQDGPLEHRCYDPGICLALDLAKDAD